MSDYRVMMGYVGVIKDKPTEEQIEAFNDQQYSNGWYINGEGTLLVQDLNRNAPKPLRLEPEGFLKVGLPTFGHTKFIQAANTLGFRVAEAKFYIELYYDGGGACIHEMTLEKFEGMQAW